MVTQKPPAVRRYRICVYGGAWVGGMKFCNRAGRTKDPTQALMFDTLPEADAAAISYDGWVQAVDQPAVT